MKKIAEIASEIVETFAISLAIFLVIYAFVAFPEVVVGASMEPTVHTGERLLVERLSAKFNKIKRGDVIIFNPPGNNNVDYVKRVIGLPNEILEISDCNVYLVSASGDKNALNEPYVAKDTCTKMSSTSNERILVPDNSYYVLGDNRMHSADSRVFGPLAKSRVDGKVFLRFWPIQKFSFF